MQKPNPNLNFKPSDMRQAVDAATLTVLTEISDTLSGIDCSMRALALMAKSAVPAIDTETIDVINDLLNDDDQAVESESD